MKKGFTLARHSEFISESKMQNKTMKLVQGDTKTAFTLAEVLITLAVIGVVAALTIPTVVQNYQKTQTVTQLKKVYSALSNTTNLAIAEYGNIASWEYGKDSSAESTKNFVEKYMTPYLKVSKVCGLSTNDVCNYNAQYLNGTSISVFKSSSYYTFILNDGTVVSAILYTQQCCPWIEWTRIYFDINGPKKPNRMGRDIFYLDYLFKTTSGSVGRFIVDGITQSRSQLISVDSGVSCNIKSQGWVCLALIIKDGWQIKDDYPWN